MSIDEVYEYLCDKAKTIGENSVKHSCKRFIKLKYLPKEQREKRINYPKQWLIDAYFNQSGRCAVCLSDVSRKDATLDHIIALSQGGKNEKSNTRILCRSCNSSKGGKTLSEQAKRTGKTVLSQITGSNDRSCYSLSK